eukprot:NODE_22_length_2694_cov_352.843397_g21_i0.p1 GENE.NODE_22_length_2694_cov_352.843397_g21_i0~~NODE_22_length_2694_cov_352.843397_g21_i0.p1  ORF type:complete len:854 (-),score=260.88 NODE_22_length_2694_cov_352.843397_g21_i0:131-2446(-)
MPQSMPSLPPALRRSVSPSGSMSGESDSEDEFNRSPRRRPAIPAIDPKVGGLLEHHATDYVTALTTFTASDSQQPVADKHLRRLAITTEKLLAHFFTAVDMSNITSVAKWVHGHIGKSPLLSASLCGQVFDTSNALFVFLSSMYSYMSTAFIALEATTPTQTTSPQPQEPGSSPTLPPLPVTPRKHQGQKKFQLKVPPQSVLDKGYQLLNTFLGMDGSYGIRWLCTCVYKQGLLLQSGDVGTTVVLRRREHNKEAAVGSWNELDPEFCRKKADTEHRTLKLYEQFCTTHRTTGTLNTDLTLCGNINRTFMLHLLPIVVKYLCNNSTVGNTTPIPNTPSVGPVPATPAVATTPSSSVGSSARSPGITGSTLVMWLLSEEFLWIGDVSNIIIPSIEWGCDWITDSDNGLLQLIEKTVQYSAVAQEAFWKMLHVQLRCQQSEAQHTHDTITTQRKRHSLLTHHTLCAFVLQILKLKIFHHTQLPPHNTKQHNTNIILAAVVEMMKDLLPQDINVPQSGNEQQQNVAELSKFVLQLSPIDYNTTFPSMLLTVLVSHFRGVLLDALSQALRLLASKCGNDTQILTLLQYCVINMYHMLVHNPHNTTMLSFLYELMHQNGGFITTVLTELVARATIKTNPQLVYSINKLLHLQFVATEERKEHTEHPPTAHPPVHKGTGGVSHGRGGKGLSGTHQHHTPTHHQATPTVTQSSGVGAHSITTNAEESGGPQLHRRSKRIKKRRLNQGEGDDEAFLGLDDEPTPPSTHRRLKKAHADTT